MSQAISQAAERIPAIDAIKAAAIVAVVMMHAGPAIFAPDPDRSVRWLTFAWTQFHVPSFLMVAGFLYYRPAAIGGSTIRGRLVRLLVPYLIASACVHALGFSTATSGREIAFQLVTGSSLVIYYFIFTLTWCIVITWPLSRAPRGFVAVAPVALLLSAIACEGWGRLAPEASIRGGFIRGHLVLIAEFYLYPLVYFGFGWLAASRREAWSAFARDHAGALLVACLAGVAGFLAGDPWTETFMPIPSAARVVYSVCAVGVLARLPVAFARSQPVRFLSQATLGIYLYHSLFQMAARPQLAAWSPLAQALALAALGLGGASLLCIAGRRLLGQRARLLLGA